MGILLAGFAVFTVNRMAAINQQTSEIAGSWMPSLGLAKDADKAFADLRVAWRNHVISSTDERTQKVEGDITIETSIVTINQHMDAIATSSREQSVGLSEVNTAVNQMDQVTQQNAAMVEEASAAGATLANEAGKLRELVSQFQLGTASYSTGGTRTAAVRAASTHSAVASVPRSMVGNLVKAFGGRTPAAAVADEWKEF
ncbi:hypothetical protein LJR030_003689 [Rhizobium sp. LjRoot30]